MGQAIAAVRGASQRRKYRRFQLNCPVRLKFPSDGKSVEVDAISRNASIGGLFLESPVPVPESGTVEFTITLQGGSMFRPILLVGTGSVVRVEPGETQEGFGLAVACSQPITEIENLSGPAEE